MERTEREGKHGTADNRKKLSFIRDTYLQAFICAELSPAIRDTAPAEPVGIVSVFFLEKATKTLDGACLLCQNGFHEDALVLGRTLLELCLHLEYIALPESADQRRIRAESFIYDGDRQRVEKLKELDKLKRDGKCTNWINDIQSENPVMETTNIPKDFEPLKSLKAMATKVGGEWECYYHFLYWSTSKLSHPSGIGSHTYLQSTDVDAEISTAIALAFPMHYHLTRTAIGLLNLDLFGPQLDSYMSRFIKSEF